jgi:hypothetical protein
MGKLKNHFSFLILVLITLIASATESKSISAISPIGVRAGTHAGAAGGAIDLPGQFL